MSEPDTMLGARPSDARRVGWRAHRIETRRTSHHGPGPGLRSWRAWTPPLVIALLVVAVWGRIVLTDYNTAKLTNPGDSISFEFYLGWNVHAILNAMDPFFTPNMYAPGGLDLGNAISVPAPSILLAPVTLLAGSTAAYNTGVLLSIFLAAWSTYLLADALTGKVVGSVAAGALMVLNPYFVGHSLGHFNLMWVFGVTLVAYLFVRHLQGRLRSRWFVVGTALIVAFTFGASTELAVTETLFGGIALVIALALASRDTRRALVRSTVWLAAGGAAGGVLALPVVYAALRSGVPETPFNPPGGYSTDLLNIAVPSNVFRLGGDYSLRWSVDWISNSAENTGYIPMTLIALALIILVRHRTRLVAGLGAYVLIALVLSLGPALVVDGEPHGWLPWALTAHVPGLDHALPGRFSTFAFAALCVLVAAGWPTTTKRTIAAAVAVAVSFALMLPNFATASMPTRVAHRDFVRSGDYRQVIAKDQIVLVLPGGQAGPGIQWVVDSDFWFRLPTGNGGGAIPPADLSTPIGAAIFFNNQGADFNGLLRWARDREVRVVLVPEDETFWTDIVRARLGDPGDIIDGIQVWRLQPSKQG